MLTEKDFHGPNLGYILELYERYQDDPDSVDESTRRLFSQWTPTAPPPTAPLAAPQVSGQL
ncbi:MAG: 2-oxoglutarate dehydrogenase E1 subunit family protein, partial [Anaerolineales bacterium]